MKWEEKSDSQWNKKGNQNNDEVPVTLETYTYYIILTRHAIPTPE